MQEHKKGLSQKKGAARSNYSVAVLDVVRIAYRINFGKQNFHGGKGTGRNYPLECQTLRMLKTLARFKVGLTT